MKNKQLKIVLSCDSYTIDFQVHMYFVQKWHAKDPPGKDNA